MYKRSLKRIVFALYKGEEDIDKNLKALKLQGSYKDYQNCLMMMTQQDIHKEYFKSLYQAKEWNDLILNAEFPMVVEIDRYEERLFIKELWFSLALLHVYKGRLLEFEKLKNQFELLFLNSQFEEAEHILDLVKEKCGLSFWYIQSKLLVLNHLDHSRYTSYYRETRDSCNDTVLQFYIRLLKRKINLKVWQIDYKNFYRENFGGLLLKNDEEKNDEEVKYLAKYVNFMCFDLEKDLTDDEKVVLVTMLQHLTIVDVYMLFSKLILELVVDSSANNTEIEEIWSKYIYSFKKNDLQMYNLASKKINDIKRFFCERRYKACKQYCREQFKDMGNYFELLDIYAKCDLFLEEKSQNKTILEKMGNIFTICYFKGASYTNYPEILYRYLRCLSDFNGYYDLFIMVADSIDTERDIYRRYRQKKMRLCRHLSVDNLLVEKEKEKLLIELQDVLGTIYCCCWNPEFRKKYNKRENFVLDEVSNLLICIDRNEEIVYSDLPFKIKDILDEEQRLSEFNKYKFENDCAKAIQIYMDTYYRNQNKTLRMDSDWLNDELTTFNCEEYLSDLDFFNFAFLMDLNGNFDGILSQTVLDSFACILMDHEISVPSEIIEKESLEDFRTQRFLENCCGEILSEAPADLYNEALYVEQKKILNLLLKMNRDRTDLKQRLDEVEKQYEDIELKKDIEFKEDELQGNKIIAEWIKLEKDECTERVINSLDKKEFSSCKEDNFENIMEEYRTLKKRYVLYVNEQLGLQIRHGILDLEFVRLLDKYYFFIPECDKDEKKEIINNNQYINSLRPDEKRKAFQSLQEFCSKLFQRVEKIKGEICFTHRSYYNGYVSLFLPKEELREGLLKEIEHWEDATAILRGIRKFLDLILEQKLQVLGNRIAEQLRKSYGECEECLAKKLQDAGINYDFRSNFQDDAYKMIDDIQQWFHLTYCRKLNYDIRNYIKKLKEQNPDIQVSFCYLYDDPMLQLDEIRCIDIILKNLIRNIEIHSGYKYNLNKADAEIKIKKDRTAVNIVGKNKISPNVERERIQENIDKINNLPKNSLQMMPIENDDHGLGFYRMNKVFEEIDYSWNIKAQLDDDIFKVTINVDVKGEEI